MTTPFIIGIDLGTTNSAVAFVDARRPEGRVEQFLVPQLTEPSLVEPRAVLPSFLYFPEPHEIESGVMTLSWSRTPDAIAGVLAREQGALAPSRQVVSAKSWLAHPGIDRHAPILPWVDASGPRISPVEASARYLMHIRDGWNATMAAGEERLRLERQQIVLTVPASFDEEARELTVEAARQADFARVTLLEEPVATFYAWLAEHRSKSVEGDFESAFEDGQVALVCDVGGGTTDFSLIRVRIDAGWPAFERIAIGEHLLLGGDNVDLALAALVERRVAAARPGVRLAITQRAALRRQCAAAKERLLGEAPPERVAVTILGTGRSVVGDAVSADLTQEDVRGVLDDFLPIAGPGDMVEMAALRDRRAGLRELGLPYETDPAVTRHLGSFLARSAIPMAGPAAVATEGGRRMVRPDLILFGGGFFTPASARDRLREALAAWFGDAPRVLATRNLEAAVALGAATYGRLRRGIGPSLALIKAGSARAYYIGLRAGARDDGRAAVCVLERGTEEGTESRLDHPFTVATNRPIAFALYSSTLRTDRAGDIVALNLDDDAHEHAPLVTVLRYGKKSRLVDLPVRLTALFTEVGTLELWCESRPTDHRWRLQFQLRNADDFSGKSTGTTGTESIDAAPAAQAGKSSDTGASADRNESSGTGGSVDVSEIVVAEEALVAADRAIRSVFDRAGPGGAGAPVTAENVVGWLEQTLGYGKTAWPLPVTRRLADVLIDVADARNVSPALEARWLNLFGFCLRPGFGAAKDPWRIGEARKVYAAGLAFPSAIQNRVEWLVLWQRVSGGFSAGQQQELAQRVMGEIGLAGKRSGRSGPQIERESWRLLASLERLDVRTRVRIGDELLVRVRRNPESASLLWSISRIGARAPLYGPLSSIVPPPDASRWVETLCSMSMKRLTGDLAAAIVQIAARTGDPLRDLDRAVVGRTRDRLRAGGIAGDAMAALDEVVSTSTADVSRVFGEPLPDGLRLALSACGSTAMSRFDERR